MVWLNVREMPLNRHNMQADQPPEYPITALRKHDFAVYDLGLRLRGGTRRDILRELRDGNSYLVDNNVAWKRLAAAYPTVNFVIGCTVSEEAENLEGTLFKRTPAEGYPNVFIAEIHATMGRVTFNRLDQHYQHAVFRQAIPTLQDAPQEHRAFQNEAAASHRRLVMANLSRTVDDLKAELAVRVLRSRSSFEDSAFAAAIATSLYLHSMPTARRATYLDPAYLNFPGDTRIVAEALYYGFGVISKDEKDVHTLSRLVEVPALTEAEFVALMTGNPE